MPTIGTRGADTRSRARAIEALAAHAGLDRNKFSGSVKQVQQLVSFWYMVCVSIIIGIFLFAVKLKEKGSKSNDSK